MNPIWVVRVMKAAPVILAVVASVGILLGFHPTAKYVTHIMADGYLGW